MSTVGSNPTLSATPPGPDPGFSCPRAERSPRGLWRRTGNAVRGNPSGVRIPPSPPATRRGPIDRPWVPVYHRRGRARWGTSGALHPQSATAGLNPRSRPTSLRLPRDRPTLRVGSHAAKVREPRQVRKEAAVSERLRVPWGDLAGAGRSSRVRGLSFDAGCTAYSRSTTRHGIGGPTAVCGHDSRDPRGAIGVRYGSHVDAPDR